MNWKVDEYYYYAYQPRCVRVLIDDIVYHAYSKQANFFLTFTCFLLRFIFLPLLYIWNTNMKKVLSFPFDIIDADNPLLHIFTPFHTHTPPPFPLFEVEIVKKLPYLDPKHLFLFENAVKKVITFSAPTPIK
jgi:hypothetical protein